jgi:hypothetical protein
VSGWRVKKEEMSCAIEMYLLASSSSFISEIKSHASEPWMVIVRTAGS